MPKPTIFSASADGKERVLFSIQERASGDLTLILKHAEWDIPQQGDAPTDEDRLIEERFSVHRSPNSQTVNAIKYTKIRKDGTRGITRHYSRAIKISNQFAPLLIRRSGNMAAPRYDMPNRSKFYSLGPFTTEHAQPIYMVLVGPPFLRFSFPYMGGHNINMMQVPFTHFTIVVIWQFLFFAGAESSSALIFKTFSDSEIAAVPDEAFAMMYMSHGISDAQALEVFSHMKYEITRSHIEGTWRLMPESEKETYKDLHPLLLEFDWCLKTGIAFSPEHIRLITSIFHPERLPGFTAPRWERSAVFRYGEHSTA